MIKQKAVRTTFTHDLTGSRNMNLNAYLNEGWFVVMCNEIRSKDGETELEYIIQKEEDE